MYGVLDFYTRYGNKNISLSAIHTAGNESYKCHTGYILTTVMTQAIVRMHNPGVTLSFRVVQEVKTSLCLLNGI